MPKFFVYLEWHIVTDERGKIRNFAKAVLQNAIRRNHDFDPSLRPRNKTNTFRDIEKKPVHVEAEFSYFP